MRIGIISENYFYSEEDDMTQIQRIDTNARLAEALIYQGVAYFAGQVPETSVEKNAYEQTKEVLTLIDKLLEKYIPINAVF